MTNKGSLNFNMQCAGGETLKEGLINGGQVEIYNLLIAEHLAGKAEQLTDISLTAQYIPTRRI